MMKLDTPEYTIEFDNVQKSTWDLLLSQFSDATIYQTWSYGEYQYGKNNLTHFVLKKGNKIVAIAQGRIMKIPGCRIGIAHFPWSPLWRNSDTTVHKEILHQALKLVYKEYVIRRGLFLRLKTNEHEEVVDQSLSSDFESEGFSISSEPHYQTIRVNLSPSLEDIRKNLRPSWRRHLNAAGKKQFLITRSSSLDEFNKFVLVYNEMYSRKSILSYNPDMDIYRTIQESLPDKHKMQIFNCQFEKDLIASLVISAMGDTGMYFFGASSNRAINENLRGSYLLHWKALQWLKENGFRWYDLRGYNPKLFPGVSRFKAGFNGQLYRYSEYTACRNIFSKSAVLAGECLVKTKEVIKNRIKRLKVPF